MNAADCEAQLRCWVEHLVVGEGLCPFAAAPLRAGRVRFAVCEATDDDAIFRAFLEEVQRLLESDERVLETTLLAVPRALARFDDYLDMLGHLEQALEELGLTSELQIASFHPHYRFAGEEEEDPSHYTNRSPCPVFHLLRQSSITQALGRWEDPEQIPERNRTRMRELGRAAVEALLTECRKGPSGESPIADRTPGRRPG
ncbi:MAG: DUF1415 domain-containing protein [Gammaproteobacteria bacterium]|nr:MAG: DUF1415 domain-containing protein [Gammaproteobacteria bacterium]